MDVRKGAIQAFASSDSCATIVSDLELAWRRHPKAADMPVFWYVFCTLLWGDYDEKNFSRD